MTRGRFAEELRSKPLGKFSNEGTQSLMWRHYIEFLVYPGAAFTIGETIPSHLAVLKTGVC